MRTITGKRITGTVKRLCLKANLELRKDVLQALLSAVRKKSGPRAKRCLRAIIENAAVARKKKLAICQDTGLPSVFVELGQELRVAGSLPGAIQEGIRKGYGSGCFRRSIVPDPLKRGKPGFLPAVLHTDIVKGSKLKLTVLAKGFGCENKGRLKMFNPTAGIAEIKRFVVDTVREAGADACPPYVVGVGIGGTADQACLLAKKALLKNINSCNSGIERQLLKEINQLKIGPLGLGGRPTALAVSIKTAPTHIAGLPAAVSISCHALRSASASI